MFENSSIFGMFVRYEVWFWAQMRCLNVFKVQSSKIRDVQSLNYLMFGPPLECIKSEKTIPSVCILPTLVGEVPIF